MATAERVGEMADTRDVQLTLSVEESQWLGNLLGSIGYPNNHLDSIHGALQDSAGVDWESHNPFCQHSVDLKREQ